MAYSPSLDTAADRIRFAVQDTDDAAPLLPEQTYVALLALHNGVEARATIAAAEALIVRVARDPDTVDVAGAVKVAWSDRLGSWRQLAARLRTEIDLGAAGTNATLQVGYFRRA